MSLANPFALAFWLGIGGDPLPHGTTTPPTLPVVVVLAGVLAGSLFDRLLVSDVVAWGRRFITPTSMRWVNGSCGVVLAAFGARLLAGTLPLL